MVNPAPKPLSEGELSAFVRFVEINAIAAAKPEMIETVRKLSASAQRITDLEGLLSEVDRRGVYLGVSKEQAWDLENRIRTALGWTPEVEQTDEQ